MKILHIVQLLNQAGIEQFVLTLLKADYDNTYIVALEGSASESIAAWPKLAKYQSRIIFANMQKSGRKATVRLIRNTCIRHSINALHSHYSAPLLYACLGSFGLKNINHVHTEHDIWHLESFKSRLIERIIFALVKNIQLVAISNYMQDALKDYFPDKQSTLIRNAVDTDFYKPGDKDAARAFFNLPSSNIIIGSVGRLSEIKGHQYLIEAMKNLPESFHLVIAGIGDLKPILLSRVQEYGLNGRVHFLGLVDKINSFYQACDLFCLPSLNEGLPLSLLEAQSANLPSVCSDVGSCAEAVDPASGLLVKAKDSAAIARACQLVYENKMGPRQFIIKNFSLESLKRKYMELYSRDTQAKKL